MRGDQKIIEVLNECLTAELTAINQYFVHAEMCANWGYKKLAKQDHAHAREEMKDAEAVIERILYLEGIPNMQRYNPVRVGEEVVEQLQADLALEAGAIERLNKAIVLCREKGDNGTRELLEGILKGEEQHADWLEAQLHIVQEVGKEAYLAEQIHE
jgi:bacterioferritin